MRTKHYRLTAAAIGAVLAASLIATLGVSSAPATSKTLLIGYSGAFTGPLSFYDVPIYDGMQFAISDLNKAGGVDGYKLKLIKNDNKTDPTLFAAQARAMLANHVNIINVGCSYQTAAPGARVADQAGVLNFGCSGPTIFGLKGVGPLTFNTWHGDPTEAAVLGAFIKQKSWTSGYWLTTNFGYNTDVSALLQTVFTKGGGKIVGQDTFNQTDTSFNAQITKLRSVLSKVQFIWVSGLSTGAPQLINQIRQAGIKLPIVGSGGGLSGAYWLKATPGLSNYYDDDIASIYGDDPGAQKNALVARFTKLTGAPPPTGHVFIGYSEIQMIAEAVRRAHGKIDSQALKTALESFRGVPTIAGPTTYTSTCHVPAGRRLAIIQVRNDKRSFLKYITPPPATVPKAIC